MSVLRALSSAHISSTPKSGVCFDNMSNRYLSQSARQDQALTCKTRPGPKSSQVSASVARQEQSDYILLSAAVPALCPAPERGDSDLLVSHSFWTLIGPTSASEIPKPEPREHSILSDNCACTVNASPCTVEPLAGEWASASHPAPAPKRSASTATPQARPHKLRRHATTAPWLPPPC